MSKFENVTGRKTEESSADCWRAPVLSRTVAALEPAILELETVEDERLFEAGLLELEARHPGNTSLLAARVRRLIKKKRFDEALHLVDSHDFAAEDSSVRAELLFDARAFERGSAEFESIIAQFPHRRDVRVSYGKRLLSQGLLARAHSCLSPLKDEFPEGTKSRELVERTEKLYSTLARLSQNELSNAQDARIIAMEHAILRFQCRSTRKAQAEGLGRLCLITGGLGAGGAERQLSRLAVELERARKRAGSIAGIALTDPVQVLVRSHDADGQNDFYLSELISEEVILHQINDFPIVAPKYLGLEDKSLLDLLDYLPPTVNYGVRRLVDYFREARTDTVSIWQDGACLFAGLAALLAGVPHIQLAIRGLPPSLRQHMHRPEYGAFYRAMAKVPGVSFISNNVAAARAYADWLEIPLDRFSIVYNGVEKMRTTASPGCEERWAEFVAATADAEHTIGGVFRFNTDKQPLLWIRFAARYIAKYPKTRFVLVGGGRLLDNARALAEELGVADRILFAGSSSSVGYWMLKFDALLLLSRFEGLPNVLIEAQFMGVKVVSTPAGGAGECLIDGVTGYILDCAERPNLDAAVDVVRSVALSKDPTLFKPGGVGWDYLNGNFSIDRMLSQYAACTSERLKESLNHPRPREAA